MAEIVTDCPRCNATRTTFDVLADSFVGMEYDWMTHHEVFAICRFCAKGTIFKLALFDSNQTRIFRADNTLTVLKRNLLGDLTVEGFVSVKDAKPVDPPAHLPKIIDERFREGAACLAIRCFNAAGAMFRLCLDMATKDLLPPEGDSSGPTGTSRRVLHTRLNWLFAAERLPLALRDLASAVREDGNDAAHDGNLSKADAEDLLDFTVALLERIYTEPARIELAKARREERRGRA